MAIPCARYLREFKNAFSDKEGIQVDVLKATKAHCDRNGLSEGDRLTVMSHDGLKVQEGIVSNVFTGEIVGYVSEELDTYDHIALQLEALEADEATDAGATAAADARKATMPKAAQYWTEFFATSVTCGDFQFSFYRVASTDLKAADIAPMVTQALTALHAYGFTVVADFCDKASEHMAYIAACATVTVADVKEMQDGENWQAFYDDVDVGHDQPVAILHPVTDEPVFIVTDPPHLIKTLYNALSKSGTDADGIRATRYLKKFNSNYNMEDTLGLKVLYDVWKRRNEGGPALGVTGDKLDKDHFFPTAHSRMRVAPAARVLSGTMARYLKEDTHQCKNDGLIDYCNLNNEFFDVMNGKSGVIQGPDDKKLAFLERYVRFYEDWNTENHDRGAGADAFIPAQTFRGVQTIRGFIWAAKYYLAKYPGKVFLPGRCSQDVCEHHFRNVRGASGDKKNPSIQDCRRAARTATVIRLYRDKKSNSGGAPVDLRAVLLKRDDAARKKRPRRPRAEPAAPSDAPHAPAAEAVEDDDDAALEAIMDAFEKTQCDEDPATYDRYADDAEVSA